MHVRRNVFREVTEHSVTTMRVKKKNASYFSKLMEHYANDPELAASKGVRAIHGEAPSIELREGKTYRIELRSSGGLSIKVE